MNILLAEDEPNIATIAVMTLETLGGHTVTHVDDGQKAHDAALAGKYDLIILDEMMPKMNGIEVCKSLIQNNLMTPIIFMSAKSQAADVTLFESIGTGYIPKPFEPSTLNAKIDEILFGSKESTAA